MITQERLKEILEYNPKTGIFTWKKRAGAYKTGSIAGGESKSTGYWYIRIDYKPYPAHRLAFLYVKGAFPSNEVDHINGIKCDNRFKNLRSATRKQNAQNVRKPFVCNKTGFLGVSIYRNKFMSGITVNKKRIHIGYFNDAEEAHQAYIEAKRKYHVGCTI